MNRAAAFDVVRQFEDALAEYTGAPYVVTVDSCTNAIFLSLLWWRSWIDLNFLGMREPVEIPRRTYVGVAQSVRNAGYTIEWNDDPWTGCYPLLGTPIWDSARRFTSGMYQELLPSNSLVCVSFQIAKHLPIGRGGAILTDNADTAAWLRRARFDGRSLGDASVQVPGYHMYLTPPDAARGLWLLSWLSRENEDLPSDDYPDLSLIFGDDHGAS